jgi:hypothetical protein
VNFAPNGTTSEDSLTGVHKYNINYKDDQFAYIDGTAPTTKTFTFKALQLIKESSYSVKLKVRVTNNLSSSQGGMFLVLYKFYEEVTAAGTTYKDVLLDASVYEAGRNPAEDFYLAAGESADFTVALGGIDGGAHGFDADDIDVADIKIDSQTHHSCATNYVEMRF